MEENTRISSDFCVKQLTVEIQNSFASKSGDVNKKWSLLKDFYSALSQAGDFDKITTVSYGTVLSTLLGALQPKLFREEWQEALFDDVFLNGIPHEAFLILVKWLNHSEKYALRKINNLLLKFVTSSSFEFLLRYQCVNHKDWDLKYVSKSNVWDNLITVIVSLPERTANKTKGDMPKLYRPTAFIPLIISTVLKVLNHVHDLLKNSQDCSLEFLSKLTGRICILGHSDVTASILLKEFIKLCKSDFIWRRIVQNFIAKMPSSCYGSFIPSLLLKSKWYGYVEWILGDEGIKNEKIHYIMTVKLFFYHPYKNVVLQNAIGYFASSPSRMSHFQTILKSLLDSWVNQGALKHQSYEHQVYIASALMVCAGWVKKLNLKLDKTEFLNKILEGTQMRLGHSKDSMRSLGMIVGEYLIKAMDPDMPPLKFEHSDLELMNCLISLIEVPSNPDNVSSLDEGLEGFDDIEPDKANVEEKSEQSEECKALLENEELDSSDDEIEPFDMSHDVPRSDLKRPLYLRDCMAGLLDIDNVEWAEKCMKHAEDLIKSNPYAAEEVAEEMTKIVLHLRDNSCIDNFVGLRRRILIALTVQCPIIVSNYLIGQFSEKEYTIQQRLDVLDVLAASSASLAYSGLNLPASETPHSSSRKSLAKKKPDWQIIIDKRLEVKSKRHTKAQVPVTRENKFSAVAGNFFYPLLNSYEKALKILKLHGGDSYVLGRLVYTLGVIMCSATNTTLFQKIEIPSSGEKKFCVEQDMRHSSSSRCKFLRLMLRAHRNEHAFLPFIHDGEKHYLPFGLCHSKNCSQMGITLLEFLATLRSHEDVFVRQAIIFSIASTYTAVPSSILFSEMLPIVSETTDWLQNVAENDPDNECVEKSLYTLSIFHSAASEGSLLYQLRNLAIS